MICRPAVIGYALCRLALLQQATRISTDLQNASSLYFLTSSQPAKGQIAIRKAKAAATPSSYDSHLTGWCSKIVVLPATAERLDDLASFQTLWRLSQSPAAAGSTILVLTMADKVKKENMPALFDRPLAGCGLGSSFPSGKTAAHHSVILCCCS